MEFLQVQISLRSVHRLGVDYEEWVSEMQCNNAEAFLPCGPSYSSLL
jgi:hypothetical protein